MDMTPVGIMGFVMGMGACYWVIEWLSRKITNGQYSFTQMITGLIDADKRWYELYMKKKE